MVSQASNNSLLILYFASLLSALPPFSVLFFGQSPSSWLPTLGNMSRICHQQTDTHVVPYTSFAVITVLSCLLPYVFSIEPNAPYFHILVLMRCVAATLCVLIVLRQYFSDPLLNKHLPVYWFGVLLFAWPIVTSFALLASNGAAVDFSVWFFGVLMVALMIPQATGPVVLWGMVLGWSLYKLEGGGNSWLSSFSEVGWGVVCISALIIRGTKWLLSGRDMPLRAQVAVLKVKQATAAHESKRPLISCRESCNEMEQEASKLSDTISALPTATPVEKQAIQRFCVAIKERSRALKTSCQSNIDFLNELIHQTHDPLQYIPKREIVSMNKCVRLGLSSANFGGARKRLQVVVKGDFEVFGNACMLGSLVVNGVENAIKHSGPNDYIEVRVQRIYGRNRLSIYNTGHGIVAWMLSFVFTAGFSQTPGGSGTGLAFSKWTVEQMDGLARVWSIWQHCTCFEYDFPCVTDQMRQQAYELEKEAQQNDPYKLLDEALKKQQDAQQKKWGATDSQPHLG